MLGVSGCQEYLLGQVRCVREVCQIGVGRSRGGVRMSEVSGVTGVLGLSQRCQAVRVRPY